MVQSLVNGLHVSVWVAAVAVTNRDISFTRKRREGLCLIAPVCECIKRLFSVDIPIIATKFGGTLLHIA